MNLLTIISFIIGTFATIVANWVLHLDINPSVFVGVVTALLLSLVASQWDPSSKHRPAKAKKLGRVDIRGFNINRRWVDPSLYQSWYYPDFNEWIADLVLTGPRLLENIAKSMFPAALGPLLDEIAASVVEEITKDWKLVDKVRNLSVLLRGESEETKKKLAEAFTTNDQKTLTSEALNNILTVKRKDRVVDLIMDLGGKLPPTDQSTRKAVAEIFLTDEHGVRVKIGAFIQKAAEDFAKGQEIADTTKSVPERMRGEVDVALRRLKELFVDAEKIRSARSIEAIEGFEITSPAETTLCLFPTDGEGSLEVNAMGTDWSNTDMGDINIVSCSRVYEYPSVELEIGKGTILYPNVIVGVPSSTPVDQSIDENIGVFGRWSHALMDLLPTMTAKWHESDMAKIKIATEKKIIENADRELNDLGMDNARLRRELRKREAVPPPDRMKTDVTPGALGPLRIASSWMFAILSGLGTVAMVWLATVYQWDPVTSAGVGFVLGAILAWILARLGVLGHV